LIHQKSDGLNEANIEKEKNTSTTNQLSDSWISKILVAVDHSENAKRALKTAVELALKYRSDLLVLNAVQIDKYGYQHGKYTEEDGQELVDHAVFSARDKGLPVKGIVKRAEVSVVETIIECATEEKVDLIVIGTRGQGGFKRLLLGSVSSGVVAHGPCNVLVVR